MVAPYIMTDHCDIFYLRLMALCKNILSEMDVKDPGAFLQITRALEPILDKK